MVVSKEPLLDPPPQPQGASVVGAALSLTKTCIGTGVLALPYGFVQGGALAIPALIALGLWN
eukprot:1664355-Prymnesium_polylepis.1